MTDLIRLEPPFRHANEADARQLADLVNFAGEGLPFYLWQGLAEDGQDPWEIGRARQASKASQGQIVVVDYGDGAVAGLTGYVIGPEPELIGEDFPPLIRPLQELENEAPDSWYVNILACYPQYRGQGLGSQLLDLADQMARAEGLHQMSVIVSDNNAGAIRLYQRHGYTEAATRSCLKEGWVTQTSHWVLLLKSL